MILNFPIHLLITIVSVGGLILASYIRYKKQKNESLVCPFESNCDVVVRSQFSRLFGIPVEVMGMSYYVLMIVSHGLFIFYPSFNLEVISSLILVVTIIAFFFSLYLTGVQAIKLKEWCAWCLISALLCSIIFLASLALH